MIIGHVVIDAREIARGVVFANKATAVRFLELLQENYPAETYRLVEVHECGAEEVCEKATSLAAHLSIELSIARQTIKRLVAELDAW